MERRSHERRRISTLTLSGAQPTWLQWSAALTSDEGSAITPPAASPTGFNGAPLSRATKALIWPSYLEGTQASMERRSHERRRRGAGASCLEGVWLLQWSAALTSDEGLSAARATFRPPSGFNGAPLSRATKARRAGTLPARLASFNGAPLSRATKEERIEHPRGLSLASMERRSHERRRLRNAGRYALPTKASMERRSHERRRPKGSAVSSEPCTLLQWSAALTSDEGLASVWKPSSSTSLQWSAALTSDEGSVPHVNEPAPVWTGFNGAPLSRATKDRARPAAAQAHRAASMERRSHERRRSGLVLRSISFNRLQWSAALTSDEGAWCLPARRRSSCFNGAPLSRATKEARRPTPRNLLLCFNGAPLSRATKEAPMGGHARGTQRFNGAPLSRATKANATGNAGHYRLVLQWSAALTSDEGYMSAARAYALGLLQWSAALTSDEGFTRSARASSQRRFNGAPLSRATKEPFPLLNRARLAGASMERRSHERRRCKAWSPPRVRRASFNGAPLSRATKAFTSCPFWCASQRLQWSAALTSDEGIGLARGGEWHRSFNGAPLSRATKELDAVMVAGTPFVLLQWSAALTSDEGARALEPSMHFVGRASMERRSHERRRARTDFDAQRIAARLQWSAALTSDEGKSAASWSPSTRSFNGAPLSRATKARPQPMRNGRSRQRLQWSAALTSDEGSITPPALCLWSSLQWSAALTSDEGGIPRTCPGRTRLLQWSAALTSDEGPSPI